MMQEQVIYQRIALTTSIRLENSLKCLPFLGEPRVVNLKAQRDDHSAVQIHANLKETANYLLLVIAMHIYFGTGHSN